MSLFRPEAIEAKRRRLWGEVRLAQPLSYAVWTVGLTFLCGAIFFVLVFGTYTRKETVAGFITPEAGIVQIRTVQLGRVARVLVREGQTVTAGTPMIELVSDTASAGQAPMLDLQLDEVDQQRRTIEARSVALERSFADERSRLISQIAGNERTRASIMRQRAVQVDVLRLVEADAQRMEHLRVQGYVPNARVDAAHRSVLSERAAVADLDTSLSQLDAATSNLRSQLAALPAQAADSLAALSGEASGLAQRRAELQAARGYVLRAPIDGTVSSLQARVGLVPSAEQPLLSLEPTGSPLEARLLVPTRAVGFLTEGQVARLQVDAFPFQRFGFVEGRILHISKTVTRPGEGAFPVVPNEAVYEIRVALDRDYVEAYGVRRSLQSGMNLRADIPIDRRRLWQQLFDPLLAAVKRTT